MKTYILEKVENTGSDTEKLEAVTSSFIVVTSMNSINRHELKFKKLHLNVQKKLFHTEGGQAVEQVTQRGCGDSISGYLKS